MAGNLQLVFSRIPDYVEEDEFNAWYEAHLDEILSIPGFVSAQRYRLHPVVVDEEAGVRYRFLAMYEIEGDLDELLKAMDELKLGSHDSYADRKAEGDDGGPALPAWWDEASFASWNCEPIGAKAIAPR